MPTEKRKTLRKIANEILEVTDQITGTHLGRVVNISAEGLMLLSSSPIDTGSVYQLDLRLPRLIKNHSQRLDHPVLPAIPETEYLKGFTFQLTPSR